MMMTDQISPQPDPRLVLLLLGQKNFFLDNQPISLPSFRPAGLLVYLAMNPGTIRRAELVELMYSDSMTEEAARSRLARTISAVRSVSGPGNAGDTIGNLIDWQEEGAEVPDDLIYVDALQFKRVAKAFTLQQLPLTARDAIALREAVELYQGAFLPGFTMDDAPRFAEWLDRERTELEKFYRTALVMLSLYYLAVEDLEQASEMVQRHIQCDNADPAPYCLCLIIEYLRSDHTQMRQIYAQAHRVFAENLPYELHQLFDELIGQQPDIGHVSQTVRDGLSEYSLAGSNAYKLLHHVLAHLGGGRLIELSDTCQQILHHAHYIARARKFSYVGSLHLFIALLEIDDTLVKGRLAQLVNLKSLLRVTQDVLGSGSLPVSGERLRRTPQLQRVLLAAEEFAQTKDLQQVDPSCLLIALIDEGERVIVSRLLAAQGLEPLRLRRLIEVTYD